MAKAQNYSRETRERAVRLVREHAGYYPSEFAAIRAVAARLGIGSAETPGDGAPARHAAAGHDSCHACGLYVGIRPGAPPAALACPGCDVALRPAARPGTGAGGHAAPSPAVRIWRDGRGAWSGVPARFNHRRGRAGTARGRNLIGCSWRSAACRGAGWPVVIGDCDVLVVPPLVCSA